MKNEHIDYSAARDDAVRYLEWIRDNLPTRGLFEEYGDRYDESRAALAKELVYAFEQLAERFIEPHAVIDQAIADHGYGMLRALMACTLNLGDWARIKEYMEQERYKASTHRHKQSERGQRSGEARRANRRWVVHAEELAKQIRKENPYLKPPGIAAEINVRWKLADRDPPSYETLVGHIRGMIKIGALAPGKTRIEPGSSGAVNAVQPIVVKSRL
jgi:hypothetical protein